LTQRKPVAAPGDFSQVQWRRCRAPWLCSMKGNAMKLLQDLLFTDYGLMSLIGIVFMLGMMVFFLRLFLSGK
jgi:hypothetical protein